MSSLLFFHFQYIQNQSSLSGDYYWRVRWDQGYKKYREIDCEKFNYRKYFFAFNFFKIIFMVLDFLACSEIIDWNEIVEQSYLNYFFLLD